MKASPTQVAHHRMHHRAGLLMISGYKLLGATVCVLIGVGALHLVGKDIDELLAQIATYWRLPESRFVNFIFEKAELLNDPMLKRIGFAAFCYAALGAVEAIGLYFEKVWAEFLTLVVTASFLPFELHELIRGISSLKMAIFAINVAVLFYLIWIMAEKAAEKRRERAAEAD